ncbi:MAG: PAS domain S-box protein [Dehalococcoidia bacterium]|nr:PAS domain S-box protein [Dehalococcoidia bacterium]MDD5493117.1 PAS domain S-box protein [Dehalococcoidia bacterium]
MKDSEDKLHENYKNLPFGVLIVDDACNIKYINEIFKRILGLPKGKTLINLNLFELPNPKDTVVPDALRQCMTERESAVLSYQATLTGQKESNFQIYLIPLVNSSNEVTGAQAFAHDISHTIELNKTLPETATSHISATDNNTIEVQHSKLQDELALRAWLLDGATDTIYVHDTVGKMLYINETACKMLGFTKEEIIGVDSRKLLPPRYARFSDQQIAFILENGEANFETEYLKKDGTSVPVDVHSAMLTLGDKQVIMGVARDISERKMAEEALKRSEERFRTVLEDMENGYFELDLKGNYIFVNDAMCKILGRSRPDIVSEHFNSFSDKSDERFTENSENIMNDTINKGVTISGTSGTIIKGDGSRRTIGFSISPMRNAAGRIIGMRGITRDITDRIKIEQQLLMAGKLASMGELAAGVAHEINNPLTAIMGYAELLFSDQSLPPEIKEDLGKIYSQSQRAAKIVQNLLTFARGYKMEHKLININELLIKTLDLRSYKHRVTNTNVSINYDPEIPEILADESQIQQVLLNLIVNAEQAVALNKSGGKINITTTHENNMVKISVADNGSGIPEKYIDKIFDPFFTTKDVGQGTGLGLSVCHGIVSEHEGTIYAENLEEGGAIFTVELPATEKTPQAAIESADRSKLDRRKHISRNRVIVVDDEEIIRDILTRILTEHGYDVDTAASGVEGLHKIEQEKYDIYLLDLKMPGIDGQELYEKILAIGPADLVRRVIFITGDTITKSTMEFLESTGRIYFNKPLEFTKLINSMQEILSSKETN